MTGRQHVRQGLGHADVLKPLGGRTVDTLQSSQSDRQDVVIVLKLWKHEIQFWRRATTEYNIQTVEFIQTIS